MRMRTYPLSVPTKRVRGGSPLGDVRELIVVWHFWFVRVPENRFTFGRTANPQKVLACYDFVAIVEIR